MLATVEKNTLKTIFNTGKTTAVKTAWSSYPSNQVWITVVEQTSMVFKVKACSDVHVVLASYPKNPRVRSYDLLLGSDGNTMTKLYREGTLVHSINTSNLLKCDVDQYLWVSWQNNIIEMGTGYEPYLDGLLLYHEKTVTYHITSAAFYTSPGSTPGVWEFGQVSGETF